MLDICGRIWHAFKIYTNSQYVSVFFYNLKKKPSVAFAGGGGVGVVLALPGYSLINPWSPSRWKGFVVVIAFSSRLLVCF